MEIKDVPSELLSQIKVKFENDPRVCELRIKQRVLLDGGHYKEALSLAREIDDLYCTVVRNYMSEAEDSVRQVEVAEVGMTDEDKELVDTLGMTLFMASDIISSVIFDIDHTLHKYDKELHFEMFNDIRQLSDMVRAKLKYFSKSSNYMDDMTWGDSCDKMYSMMLSKAKSIRRKEKDNPRWGKNIERLMH